MRLKQTTLTQSRNCWLFFMTSRNLERTCWVQKWLCRQTICIEILNCKERCKTKLIRRVLLFQEFDFEVNDRKSCENQVADHLSWLEAEEKDGTELQIDESFPNEQVLAAIWHNKMIVLDALIYNSVLDVLEKHN